MCLCPVCVPVCVSVCVCLCVSRKRFLGSETVEVIIGKLGMVTASDLKMHHVLIYIIILTVTFIRCHTDLNHENNKCLIISETIHAMSIEFAVKIV